MCGIAGFWTFAGGRPDGLTSRSIRLAISDGFGAVGTPETGLLQNNLADGGVAFGDCHEAPHRVLHVVEIAGRMDGAEPDFARAGGDLRNDGRNDRACRLSRPCCSRAC